MRRSILEVVVLAALAVPSAATAQSAEAPAAIGVVAAPPAWLGVAAPDPEELDPAAPATLVTVRRADKKTGTTLMIVGLAGVITGLIVDESAITVLGAVVGGVGLYFYLR